MEIFIESSKTDINRDCTRVVIARVDSALCPAKNLEHYFKLGNISETLQNFLFRGVTKTSQGYRLREVNKPLTYSRVREIIMEAFKNIVPNIKSFGLHSLRLGGASASVCHGISDRF